MPRYHPSARPLAGNVSTRFCCRGNPKSTLLRNRDHDKCC
jgi:hypothetical protein